MYSWRLYLKACFVALFVALLADEIGEHFPKGHWVHMTSLAAFGISMAVAFITACMATAALLSPQGKGKT